MCLSAVDMTFTAKNVQRAVQEVEDTDTMASYLRVPDSVRDEIKKQFRGVAQQVKAYIDYFMEHDPLASWRAVITVLDMLGETRAADAICHLAEPVTGAIWQEVLYKGLDEHFTFLAEIIVTFKSVRPSVCLLPRFLPLRATRRPKSETNGFSATLALF